MPDLQIDPEDIESPATAEQSQNSEEVQLKKQELTTVDELQGKDLVVGTGTEAVEGSKVTVHYTGTLTNGQKFDSSVDRGEPFSFTIGAGQVIKGWDMGIVGMKVGGKRQLFIPAKLAYGDQGIGSIPPGATLVFEIELLKVE
ncbi:FKBP-type peptidyl-prolyl cis-trans isomerase [Candidatus Beckwithbacteria bacterium]|nr:FKBP-type peptidyl-prolyl cis-trans isomerase [Candidatus Beckwithbacteria bacterium]